MRFPENNPELNEIFKGNDLVREQRAMMKNKKVTKVFTRGQLKQWRESVDLIQDYYNNKYSFIDRHKESYEKRLENAKNDIYSVKVILARHKG